MDLDDLDCAYLAKPLVVVRGIDGQGIWVVVHGSHDGDSYWHRHDSICVMPVGGDPMTDAFRLLRGTARQLADGLRAALDNAQAAPAPDPAAARADHQARTGSGCRQVTVCLTTAPPDPRHTVTVYSHCAHAQPGHARTYVGLRIDGDTGVPRLQALLAPEKVPALADLLESAVHRLDPEDDWRYLRLQIFPPLLVCPRTEKIGVLYDRTCTRTIGVTLHRAHSDEQDGHADTTISLRLAEDEGKHHLPPSVITMSSRDARRVLGGVLQESAALANQLPDLRRTISSEAGWLKAASPVRVSGGAKLQAEVHYGHEGASEEGHEVTCVNLRAWPQEDEPSWVTCSLEVAEVHELAQYLMNAIEAAERPATG